MLDLKKYMFFFASGNDGVITPVTNGMTLDHTWDTAGQNYGDLIDATQFSMRVDIEFIDNEDGVIMESGGPGFGMILYVHNNTLYFQCMNGGSFGKSADRVECSWPIQAGNRIVEVSANKDKGGALYIDGQIVEFDDAIDSLLGGSNAGTVGGIIPGVAVNRGGFSESGTSQGYPGSYSLLIFDNEITPEVTV